MHSRTMLHLVYIVELVSFTEWTETHALNSSGQCYSDVRICKQCAIAGGAE